VALKRCNGDDRGLGDGEQVGGSAGGRGFLFSDTKVREDLGEEVFGGDGTGDGGERVEGFSPAYTDEQPNANADNKKGIL